MDVETTDHLSYDNEDADVDYAADDADDDDDDDDFKPFTPSQSLASSGQSSGKICSSGSTNASKCGFESLAKYT